MQVQLPRADDAGAAINHCLSEVRAALAGLEAAANSSLRTAEAMIQDTQLRAEREAAESRVMVEQEARRAAQKAETAEARVERLEEKLRLKKEEAHELKATIDRYTSKLEKADHLLALEDREAKNGAKAAAAVVAAAERQAAAAAAASGGQTASPESESDDDDETEAKEKRKEADGHSSEDTSVGAHKQRRRARAAKGVESASRGKSPRSGSSSRSPESGVDGRNSNRYGSYEQHGRGDRPRTSDKQSRYPKSPGRDSRSRGRGGRRGETGEQDRSYSRHRSRSRRPWRTSYVPGGSASKGQNKGSKYDTGGLCIPFVIGNCHWGDKCRDRHPDLEDAKSAKESLQSKLCRFGTECRRRDCIFRHPEGKRNEGRR